MNRWPALVCLSVTHAALAAQGDPQPGSQLPLEREVVVMRNGEEFALDAGFLEVPENRGVPDSRRIRVAFVRARSPRAQPGPPVFLLAGGPGGSSVEMVQQFVRNGGPPFLEMLGGDVIGIDQRGVGRSMPNLMESRPVATDPTLPGDPDRDLQALRKQVREYAAELRGKGIDLNGYNTAESADDVDAVRTALGYDRIVVWGASYGSHLAMSVLRRHEAAVERAVLIGPEGPDHTVKLPSYAQVGLERLAASVAADPALGARIPDLVGLVGDVLQAFDEGPLYCDVDGQRVGISKHDVQWVLANELGLVRGHMDRLPARLLEWQDGRWESLARDLVEERKGASTGPAMTMVMDSASGLSPARRARIAAELEDSLLGAAVNFPFPDVREAWGVEDLGEGFRAPLQSSVPVLFIVGDLDARTPIANARELLEGLPNGHLIVVENAGHDLNFMQGGLREAWSRFLRGDAVELDRIAAPKVRFAPPGDRP